VVADSCVLTLRWIWQMWMGRPFRPPLKLGGEVTWGSAQSSTPGYNKTELSALEKCAFAENACRTEVWSALIRKTSTLFFAATTQRKDESQGVEPGVRGLPGEQGEHSRIVWTGGVKLGSGKFYVCPLFGG
jgi:hypothetical protein